MRKWVGLLIIAVLALLPSVARAADTNATYFNDAALPAADPYVLHDSSTGYYYAYSTDGADAGYYFGIYRSADLVTWEKVHGGALPVNDPKQWGNDWFWAPEVYRNPTTGLYFMFYAARSDANAKRWFGYADFAEPCKIGVAVSRSPEGPFHNIAADPIDYNPYDPDYHDVNLLMGPDQKQPPATLEQGRTAPLGTYIPTIDPDVYFGDEGAQYLYFSRNAYRNWNWDPQLGKYIEESNILAVPLSGAWWNDPTGRTMPTIDPTYKNAKAAPGGPAGPRRDGWVQIISYQGEPQAWENAHVNDYATTGGQKKDRRWEEGSTTFKHVYVDPSGMRRSVYYLTYSANNWESPFYGVGYAVAPSPLGPWKKFAGNPVLSQNPQIGMYSTGHGSVAMSPDGRELYYVHHGRPSATADQRRLYTERMTIRDDRLDAAGTPILSIDQATSDRPVPSGVAPYAIRVSARQLRLRAGAATPLRWEVTSSQGAHLALTNPLNRVSVEVADARVADVRVADDGSGGSVIARAPGSTRITLTYQRELAGGGYRDVFNLLRGWWPVTRSVEVTVTKGGRQRGGSAPAPGRRSRGHRPHRVLA
jgi:GH43 family beta-xylosidase